MPAPGTDYTNLVDDGAHTQQASDLTDNLDAFRAVLAGGLDEDNLTLPAAGADEHGPLTGYNAHRHLLTRPQVYSVDDIYEKRRVVDFRTWKNRWKPVPDCSLRVKTKRPGAPGSALSKYVIICRGWITVQWNPLYSFASPRLLQMWINLSWDGDNQDTVPSSADAPWASAAPRYGIHASLAPKVKLSVSRVIVETVWGYHDLVLQLMVRLTDSSGGQQNQNLQARVLSRGVEALVLRGCTQL